MGGIHSFTSSLFIHSGSKAQFKSGIFSPKITSKGAIFAKGFKDLGVGVSTEGPELLVGTQSADGSLIECITTINTPVKLSASGNFNHFTFVEKRLDGWFQISSGSQNGLIEKSFVDVEGKPTPGIYEYLVLAMSTSSLKTVAKGTTVTVINNSQA